MDVDEYSSNPRVRKALRSLATYGTSLGVAQAVMWRVCNDLPFETMAEQTGKVMNIHEIALAARFVEALDASSTGELVDPAALVRARASSSRCGAKGRWPARPSGWPASSTACDFWGFRSKSLNPKSFRPPRPPRSS